MTVHLATTSDVPKITNAKVIESLQKVKLKVVQPKASTSAKTVLISKLTSYFTAREEVDIMDEINHSNNVKAVEVYKFPNTHAPNSYFRTIKVKFATIEDADKIMDKGLKLFNVNLDKVNIHKERNISVVQCFRCLRYNHTVQQCNSSESFCSICSGKHNYTVCENKEP